MLEGIFSCCLQGEKYLYLKQENLPAHRPPSGRAPTQSVSSERSSVSSYQDAARRHPYPQAPLQARDSLTYLQPEHKSVVSTHQPPPPRE